MELSLIHPIVPIADDFPFGQLFSKGIESSIHEATCYKTFRELDPIRDEWNRLARRIDADVFSSYEWCESWWRHFSADRNLEIHCVRRRGELVAVFPLFRETIGPPLLRVRAIRAVGCDHAGTRCALLVDPEELLPCASLLLRAIDDADPDWHCLHFGDLPGWYDARSFARALRRAVIAHKIILRLDRYPHAVFHVPRDFQTYLRRLSRNERHNLRRIERRLRTHGPVAVDSVASDEIPSALDEMFRWHSESWRSRGALGFFDQWPGAKSFHTDVAAEQSFARRLVLLRLRVGTRSLGYVYAMLFGRRLHLFQVVRSPDPQWTALAPGRLLHAAAMRWAIDAGLDVVDAMSGFYEYKRRLGANFLGLAGITLLRRGLATSLRVRMLSMLVRMIDLAYFRVWYSRVVPLLRLAFPSLRRRFLEAGMSRFFIRSRFLASALSLFDRADSEINS